MAYPKWFDVNVYLANKLAQLQQAEPNANWTAPKLDDTLAAAGFVGEDGAYQHFEQYGAGENLSPNTYFNAEQYFYAKAAQANNISISAVKDYHVADIKVAIKDAGLNAWTHYHLYGSSEGVNPSNSFDEAAYLTAKLADLQAKDSTNWPSTKTIADLQAAFKAAGLSALEHYLSYGVTENFVTADKLVVPAANQAPVSATGQTFTLTAGTDVIPAEGQDNSGDDTIEGVVSALTADNTLNALDQIDGGEGNDTLKVDLQSNFTGFTGTGKLANVENIELTNSGTIGRNFDATGVTGAQKYVLNAGESSISLSNLAAAGVTVDVVGQKEGTTTVGFTTKAVEGTADALTLGVNGVGTAEVKDASGTVTSAAKYVSVTATGIENLTVNATGANLVNLAGAATKTITAAGEGSLNVEAVGTVTSFDASGVKGAVTANLTGAAAGTLATVKGGEGDDVVTVDLADLTANATISGGAGANTLKVSGAGTIQPTLSQFQTVELNGITGDSTISAKNVSDLATLAIKGTTALANTVTVAGLNSAALTVQTEGAQGGAVQLTSPTVLTYNTTSTAANTTAKTQQTVTTAITANEATNATINVGAYTKQTGDITVNKATAVTLNVASGKDAAGTTEQTAFDANLTANTAQSLIVKADGVVGSTGSTKKIVAGAATLLDVNAAAGGEMIFETGKAQQVNITAGAALDITGSKFDAAEQVTIAANVGYTNGTSVNLGKISTLNLSGAGTATDKLSQVKLGTLGSATDITNAITVTATGLKGGAEVGTIDTKGGNVTLTATEMTGHFKTGAIGGGTNKVGNVTVNAASLGSTEIGAISTVAGATVQVNATGLLGKEATSKESLQVGSVLVATDASKNTGAVSVTVDGSNAFDLSALQAKTVTVDLSNFLGTVVDSTGGEAKGKIGTITGQTVTVKGGSLASNTITIDAMQNAAETAAAVTVTGGLGDDKLTIDTTADITADDAVTISFTGAGQLASGKDSIVFDDNADLTHASSKLTLSGVEEIDVASGIDVVVKAADLSGAEIAVGTSGGTLTLKGTGAADTIDASKITGGAATTLFINGGKAADTIKLTEATTDAAVVQVNVTSNTTGSVYSTESSTTAYDKVTNFKVGTDKLSIVDTDGSAQTFTLNTGTTDTGATADGVVSAISDGKGVISFTKGNGSAAVALAAGSAEIDTLAEIVDLVDANTDVTLGKVVGFEFGGNTYVFGQNGTADVLVELTGVTGITDFTGIV